MQLVPIRIKITRGVKNGQLQNIYPAFNELDPSVRGNCDWAQFIDQYGIGHHYDHECGFGETDAYNDDPGVQYTATCVPAAFASAAVDTFPNLVEILSETDFEAFYNTRSHDKDDTEVLDTEVLMGIQARIALEDAGAAPAPSTEIRARRTECLDPTHKRRGIRKNLRKKWADFKTLKGIEIVTP
jgi:hypothetical protein